jgi:hypothetical protein
MGLGLWVISLILLAKSCSLTAQPLPTFTGSLISAGPKPAWIKTSTTAPIQIGKMDRGRWRENHGPRTMGR